MTDLAHATGRDEVEAALGRHRRELTGYCYRMLGSVHEAEDAVQETLLRAWRAAESYEGRAAVRSWLYRIATNVCLDAIKRRRRRQRPVDLGPAATASTPLGEPLPEQTFIEPIPDVEALASTDDPASDVMMRESIRLAFVAALQLLPARQRAVLILCEVLRWPAADVADLLDNSVASVNSALQRARATLAEQELDESELRDPQDHVQRVLLDRYVDAFERYDLDALVELLHEDLVMSMPPYDLWLRGPEQLREWFLGAGHECRGSVLVPVEANGAPGYAQYRKSEAPGQYHAWAIQVLDVVDGRITALTSFLDTTLFARFGLPDHLDHPPA
ncbi:sigma-70 family RNA polymerase sigma factor [soil metagenome]